MTKVLARTIDSKDRLGLGQLPSSHFLAPLLIVLISFISQFFLKSSNGFPLTCDTLIKLVVTQLTVIRVINLYNLYSEFTYPKTLDETS